MIGIFLALCVAFLKSLGELASKSFTDTSKKDSLDEYSLIFGARALSVILLFPLVFIVSFQLPSQSAFIALIVSSLLNSVTNITAVKAVKYGDLSLVSPLSSLSIPFLLISSYLITHEQVNAFGFLGVAIIFFGTYFLGIENIQKRGIFGPFLALFENTGARYMFLTALLWSITSPFDKIGTLELGALNWMLYTNTLVSIFVGLFIVFFCKNASFTVLFEAKHLKKISGLTIIGGLGVFLQLLALKYTLVIYVIALKRASGMFSVFLGQVFYKEKNILQKMIAAGIMLAGVLIISIFGNI